MLSAASTKTTTHVTTAVISHIKHTRSCNTPFDEEKTYSRQQREAQGLIDMILLAGRGHAPHTQTAKLLMARPCSGMTSATGTAGSVGTGKQGEFY